MGTSVVTHQDGSAALGRVAHLVEQICDMHRAGKQVILVTSGAGALGRRRIRQAMTGNYSAPSSPVVNVEEIPIDKRAAAAAGQSALMSMYEALFAQKQLACSQILLTDSHFLLESGRSNLRAAISALLELRIVPIINENDVTSIGGGVFSGSDHSFWDNDSMASLICRELKVELAIFLTDVEGLCRTPPAPGTKPDVVHTFVPGVTSNFKMGSVSKAGRGGMQAKVDAAVATLKHTRGVVIASGFHHDTIARILAGEKVGTFFTHAEEPEPTDAEALRLLQENDENFRMASEAKEMSRKIQTLSGTSRAKIITNIAESLWKRKSEILEANQQDIVLAQTSHVSPSLQARLVLNEAKLKTLVDGLNQIANCEEPIGRVVERMEMADGLLLEKSTVPIGVLLVIFESRPDVLPQVASLAIRSGNGLILKGGKEASSSNKILHTIIGDAIEEATEGVISRALVGLVDSREAVKNLLTLDKVINLVIPRGSGELVRYIQGNTKIPVLGHADGICHVYVDKEASLDKAISICIDAKTEYPAACNAMETLLIHKDWPSSHVEQLVLAFRQAKVELFGGALAGPLLELSKAPSMHTEYGRLAMTIEFVDDVHAAIKHINTNSSSHTDSIVTENSQTASTFLEQVDSACVFHNASTRFADGYRFGLGAEVGISTSRIHARGPVGIEGLMTSKWTLISSEKAGSIVHDYSKGNKQYTHKKLQ
jgi:delta-1-pyrroline-5-carboxylate synthetase